MPFFDFSMPQLLIVFVIGLIVFGPKRLPEMTKQLGRGLRDFQKGMDGVMEDVAKPTATTAAAADPAPTTAAAAEPATPVTTPAQPAE